MNRSFKYRYIDKQRAERAAPGFDLELVWALTDAIDEDLFDLAYMYYDAGARRKLVVRTSDDVYVVKPDQYGVLLQRPTELDVLAALANESVK